MAVILTLTPNDSLTATVAAAVDTSRPIAYATTIVDGTPNHVAVELDGAATTTVVASPQAGYVAVESIHVCNADTGVVTISFNKVQDGIAYTLASVSLDALDSLTWTEAGIRVVDASGQAKQTIAGGSVAVIPIVPTDWRVHDDIAAQLPAVAMADDLGIVLGIDGSDFVSLQSEEFQGGLTTAYARAFIALPPNYVADTPVTIRILGGMLDAIADTACTVDIEAYSKTTMNAGSADMCITDAQSINTLDFSTVDFVVSPGAAPTGLSPGQLLNIRLTVAGVDEGTPTAVVACVANASLRCAVR